MPIELIVEPRKVYTWKGFREQNPPYSIALDGLVDGKTARDPRGPYANFDHHAHVDRTATRSTSEQIHLEINLGLFDTFRMDGLPHARIYVNDPDEDTCLAWWLLQHHEAVMNHAQPQINRLVYCEDRLDSTAGSYPFGDIAMRRRMAWIFQPYNEARFAGQIAQMDAVGMQNVMEAVSARISGHIFGDGGEIPLEGNYENIGGGSGWTLTRETGPASRMAMYADGIPAFVSLVSERDDGNFVYVLGRRSVWTSFNLPKFYRALNKADAAVVTPSNRWGGSDTIGGSPRQTGSTLSPEQLQKIINASL